MWDHFQDGLFSCEVPETGNGHDMHLVFGFEGVSTIGYLLGSRRWMWEQSLKQLQAFAWRAVAAPEEGAWELLFAPMFISLYFSPCLSWAVLVYVLLRHAVQTAILWKRREKCEMVYVTPLFSFVFSQSHHQQTSGNSITGWTKLTHIKCHQLLPWTAISHPPKATKKRAGIRGQGAGTLIKADPRTRFLLHQGEIPNPPKRARRAVAAGRNHLPRVTAPHRGGL